MDPRHLLQTLMDDAGLNPNSLSAATRGRTKQPQIFRFVNGLSKEPKRSTLEPLADYFGVPVDAFFDPLEAQKVADMRGFTDTPAITGGVASQARLMSFERPTLPPPIIQWGNLMTMGDSIPPEFRVTAPDEALAPRLRQGQRVTLDTRALPARPGDCVLVEDKTGNIHLRIYSPGVGRWTGRAENTAYQDLDSERDGLTVLAVLTAHEGRWG
jgi:hypothetical protein